MSDSNVGTMRIYGCGGLGVNITSYFNNSNLDPNCAAIQPAYIDTSRSNLKSDLSEEDVFILPNVDGSGKVRKENHQEISNVIKQILQKMVPSDFNVVVFSASGGSGSVIGPLIMSELLERGLSAVCCVVGSDESIITAQNTLNTLKSLDAISKHAKLPVVMYYDHNDRKRSEVNREMQLAISALAVLASKKNEEMDSKDVQNWVQFNKTTVVEPQLAMLEIFSDAENLTSVKDPLTVASLYSDKDISPLPIVPEYVAAGYLTEKDNNEEGTYIGGINELHFVISIDAIPQIAGGINKTLEEYNSQRDSRVKQASVLTADDEVSDGKLVL